LSLTGTSSKELLILSAKRSRYSILRRGFADSISGRRARICDPIRRCLRIRVYGPRCNRRAVESGAAAFTMRRRLCRDWERKIDLGGSRVIPSFNRFRDPEPCVASPRCRTSELGKTEGRRADPYQMERCRLSRGTRLPAGALVRVARWQLLSLHISCVVHLDLFHSRTARSDRWAAG